MKRRTRMATFTNSFHARQVAKALHVRILPRRGYVAVVAEGPHVFLEHTCPQPSYDVNVRTIDFVAGYKFAQR